ncbi:MAG: poly(ADP-ribose) glycohydrolase ARH3, partial [Myxococcota bacterium]
GPDDVVDTLGNGITALTSCATALYVALRFRTVAFDTMLRFVIDCGGDVDTIAAMAGAMWGAARGYDALPQARIEGRTRLLDLADRVFAFGQPSTKSNMPSSAPSDSVKSMIRSDST